MLQNSYTTHMNTYTYATQLTKSTHWVPCHTHTSPHPSIGHLHTQQHSPHLTCTDTRHHAGPTPIPCASRHTSPRSHMSQTCHHKPTPMLTPITWPAAHGTMGHPCHLSLPRGAVRSQEREFWRFPERLIASQPSPNTYLSSSLERSPQCRSLE